jgi:hypothetical protein
MHLKSLLLAAAVLSAAAATLSFTAPASAQHAREAEIIGFHQLCERGDRKGLHPLWHDPGRKPRPARRVVACIPTGGPGSINSEGGGQMTEDRLEASSSSSVSSVSRRPSFIRPDPMQTV